MKSLNRYLIALVDQLNNCAKTILLWNTELFSRLYHNLLIRRLKSRCFINFHLIEPTDQLIIFFIELRNFRILMRIIFVNDHCYVLTVLYFWWKLAFMEIPIYKSTSNILRNIRVSSYIAICVHKCIYVLQMYMFSRLCFPDVYTHLCTHSEKNRKEIFKREMGREEKQDEKGE